MAAAQGTIFEHVCRDHSKDLGPLAQIAFLAVQKDGDGEPVEFRRAVYRIHPHSGGKCPECAELLAGMEYVRAFCGRAIPRDSAELLYQRIVTEGKNRTLWHWVHQGAFCPACNGLRRSLGLLKGPANGGNGEERARFRMPYRRENSHPDPMMGGVEKIRRNRSLDEKVAPSPKKRESNPIEHADPRLEGLTDSLAAAVEQATGASSPEPAGPVIDPGELVAVAEKPKPTEEVKPVATPTAEPAKPAPVVSGIVANVEYDGGWPACWAGSGELFMVEPDEHYAAICQAKDCGKHFVARGGVVHGLREAHRPALCPDHRYCKCGQLAVDVFHAKGVPGLELADGQPVCWECRGRLIQRQKAALKESLEPCPNAGQRNCMGKKKPGHDVCAGCKQVGRTAPADGINGRMGAIATPPVEKECAIETATVPANLASVAAA